MNPYGPPGGGGPGQPPYPPHPQGHPQHPGQARHPGQAQQAYGQPQGHVQHPGQAYPQQQPQQPYPQQPQQAYGQPPQQQAYPQQPQQQAYGQPQQRTPQPAGYRPVPTATPEPDHDRKLRIIGLWLWILGIAAGIVLNIFFTVLEIVMSRNPSAALDAVGLGALFAFVPLVIYLAVPALLDRYDPEPWWCLVMAFTWGAFVATGFAAMINTGVSIVASEALGAKAGDVISAVISAPIAEEFWKGLAVFGFFYFLRREFDGVVDGIIYAVFCALGFAAIENVSYYARAASEGGDVLAGTFLIRGLLAPWGHPLYTAMTGIGFGIARESSKKSVRIMAPLIGFSAGVFLHATWNFVPTVLGGEVFVVSLLLWFCFVAIFFVIVVVLVARKGRVIRDHLTDEVLIGNLTNEELELVCSPIGRIKATFSWRGATGRKFIRASARLALSKWHTARAMKGQKRTISADFIVPMRQEIAKLRAEMAPRAPRGYR